MEMPLNFSAITFQANARNNTKTELLLFENYSHFWGLPNPEKIQTETVQGGCWGYTFLKTSPDFFYYDLGNSRQNKAQPLDNPENCVRSLGNSKAPKTKTPGNPTLFFLGHHWKFFIFN